MMSYFGLAVGEVGYAEWLVKRESAYSVCNAVGVFIWLSERRLYHLDPLELSC